MDKTFANADKTDVFLSLFSNLKKLKPEQLLDKTTMETNIIHLLYFYKCHKHLIDRRHARRIIFHELPDFCFENHVENGIIVTDILRCIHELPPTCIPNTVLFMAFKCLTNRTLPTQTIQEYNKLKKASFDAVTYFLHYAYQQKLVLNNRKLMHMITFTNPLLFAQLLFFANSKSLISLVQYGLRFEFPKKLSPQTHPIFLCAAELLCRFIEVESCKNSTDLQARVHHARLIDKLEHFCRNFKILLLSTSNPHKTKNAVAHAVMKYRNVDDVGQLQVHFEQFFSDLDFQNNQPSNLQHTCRYVVRSRLDERWLLPYGVWKLPLPRKLSSYLNFNVDEKGNEMV